MKKVLQIEGLDCAACAAELEEEIKKIDGVRQASLAFVNQKLTIEYDDEATLKRVIACVDEFEEARVVREAEDTIVLRIENLDCPVCAEALQGELAKIKGVTDVSVDFVTQTITLAKTTGEVLLKVVKKVNAFEEVRVVEGGVSVTKEKKRGKAWLQIVLSALLLLGGVLLQTLGEGKVAHCFEYALYAAAYFVVGYPVLLSTVKNLSKGRIFDENFLMTVASVGAFALGERAEGVVVMLLYQLGELLQSIAVGASRNSVSELMALKSEFACVRKDGEEKRVKPEEICVGDLLVVKAGERVPVDGELLSESATLDGKAMTGESEWTRLKKGEEILSGFINAGGVVEMKATRVYTDSAVGRILDMVENASSGKAKPEKFIAKFARVYTPLVCLAALLLAVCAPLLNGLIRDGAVRFVETKRWIRSALTFLVVSCPCALVISVPLTYFSGIGACAKAGILVKGATYLDVAANAKLVAFDKTGTLTEGNFTVCGVRAEEGTEEELLSLAAALERDSAHPLAKAFEGVHTDRAAENTVEYAGEGLRADVSGERVLVGNDRLLARFGIVAQRYEGAYTPIFVAKGERCLGVVEVGDCIKSDAKAAIDALKKMGFTRTIMLTGDRKERAGKIANELGVSEVNAELLPNEKLEKAEALKREGGLIYVGDGINDAPVMTAADCAVSMGKLGSAAAVEASDLVLISDRLSALPKGIAVARKTKKIVRENVVFSIVMKVAFMALGAIGVLPLWLAVFGDVGVMLLAVLNSFRVRK